MSQTLSLQAYSMTPEELGGSGFWAAVGSAIVATVSGGLYLRQRLSKDSTAAANDRSERGMLDFLSKELEKANTRTEAALSRASLAEQRADQMAKERNEQTRTIGQLEGQITALRQQVDGLSAQIAQLAAERKP